MNTRDDQQVVHHCYADDAAQHVQFDRAHFTSEELRDLAPADVAMKGRHEERPLDLLPSATSAEGRVGAMAWSACRRAYAGELVHVVGEAPSLSRHREDLRNGQCATRPHLSMLTQLVLLNG